MPELTEIEKPKTAGFVDRGYNHSRKQKRMEEEEAEIARLEAEARGEKVEELKVNPVARILRTPKFKQQTIPNKKKPKRKPKHRKTTIT